MLRATFCLFQIPQFGQESEIAGSVENKDCKQRSLLGDGNPEIQEQFHTYLSRLPLSWF